MSARTDFSPKLPIKLSNHSNFETPFSQQPPPLLFHHSRTPSQNKYVTPFNPRVNIRNIMQPESDLTRNCSRVEIHPLGGERF